MSLNILEIVSYLSEVGEHGERGTTGVEVVCLVSEGKVFPVPSVFD